MDPETKTSGFKYMMIHIVMIFALNNVTAADGIYAEAGGQCGAEDAVHGGFNPGFLCVPAGNAGIFDRNQDTIRGGNRPRKAEICIQNQKSKNSGYHNKRKSKKKEFYIYGMV